MLGLAIPILENFDWKMFARTIEYQTNYYEDYEMRCKRDYISGNVLSFGNMIVTKEDGNLCVDANHFF